MYARQGVRVDSWLRIDGSCNITCDVIGDETQLRFGGMHSGGLDLVVTEEGLEKLITPSTTARDELRTTGLLAQTVRRARPRWSRPSY